MKTQLKQKHFNFNFVGLISDSREGAPVASWLALHRTGQSGDNIS